MFTNQYNYNLTEIVEAISNPVNRHETRVKYSCDDEILHKHPEFLIDNWTRSGRAVEFIKEMGRWK